MREGRDVARRPQPRSIPWFIPKRRDDYTPNHCDRRFRRAGDIFIDRIFRIERPQPR
jgi:hypothetical protein